MMTYMHRACKHKALCSPEILELLGYYPYVAKEESEALGMDYLPQLPVHPPTARLLVGPSKDATSISQDCPPDPSDVQM